MGTITARISQELFKDIKKIEKEEAADRAEVIRRLLADAVKRWKLKKALEMIREGRVTFRTAAKTAGLTYIEMLDEAEKASISIGYALSDLQQDLKIIKQEK
ncbi:MAG: UPF0175 family protein [Euryarchaeota archaeon]|nr:UPF0175 family protein [Euryarchaeota archaeon]